jgi:hypothetical protein
VPGRRDAILYFNPQEPGPPGLPQVWQALGQSAEAAAVPDRDAKADSFFLRSVPWHFGHSTAGEDPRTRVSNSLPQAAQAYSKIGMMAILG